jgi:hypothetical protein
MQVSFSLSGTRIPFSCTPTLHPARESIPTLTHFASFVSLVRFVAPNAEQPQFVPVAAFAMRTQEHPRNTRARHDERL